MPGAELDGRPGALKATTEELVWRKEEREKRQRRKRRKGRGEEEGVLQSRGGPSLRAHNTEPCCPQTLLMRGLRSKSQRPVSRHHPGYLGRPSHPSLGDYPVSGYSRVRGETLSQLR